MYIIGVTVLRACAGPIASFGGLSVRLADDDDNGDRARVTSSMLQAHDADAAVGLRVGAEILVRSGNINGLGFFFLLMLFIFVADVSSTY